MTREQFDYMAENVLGSGTYEDGEKFSYFVRGASVIVQREQEGSEWFLMQEWTLGDDGEPYMCGEWYEK